MDQKHFVSHISFVKCFSLAFHFPGLEFVIDCFEMWALRSQLFELFALFLNNAPFLAQTHLSTFRVKWLYRKPSRSLAIPFVGLPAGLVTRFFSFWSRNWVLHCDQEVLSHKRAETFRYFSGGIGQTTRLFLHFWREMGSARSSRILRRILSCNVQKAHKTVHTWCP